ncbi:beta-adaptin C-like protein, partial [Trifolium pratense]
VVLNNATMETDNPDLRDRAYIYWRLLSTDPEAAKDVVLAEKPVITDDSNNLDPSLLDELLVNIATLSSVYHKPPEAFVTRTHSSAQKTEDDEYPDGIESESSVNPANGPGSPPTSSYTIPASPPPAAAPVPDLLGDLIGMDNNSIVPLDQPANPSGPPLPVVLPASTGQGLQVSAQLTRRDGQVFYSMLFENNSQVPLDGFMIQFNKNTFGLAAAGPLQVPQLQPGTSTRALLPMVMFQNMSQGPPSSVLQVALKNNQQPVWSLPDSNEVSKDFPAILIGGVDATVERLDSSNIFFIAKRKNANQDVFYFSAKLPQGIPLLVELTTVVGNPVSNVPSRHQALKCQHLSSKPSRLSVVAVSSHLHPFFLFYFF